MEEGEKALMETIRKIVKEELLVVAHRTVMKEIIIANIYIKNDRLDNISKEVANLKLSLEFTQDQMKDDLGDIKKEFKKSDKNIKEVEDDLLHLHYALSKLTGLEDRSRRTNLQIDGIEETPNKTWEEFKASAQDKLKEKLEITDDIELEQCHRMSR